MGVHHLAGTVVAHDAPHPLHIPDILHTDPPGALGRAYDDNAVYPTAAPPLQLRYRPVQHRKELLPVHRFQQVEKSGYVIAVHRVIV